MSSALGGVKKSIARPAAKAHGSFSNAVGAMLFIAVLYVVHEVGADDNGLAQACLVIVMLFGIWLGRRTK